MSKSSFTVFFEGPFWVGVYQREAGGRLFVCRVVFGAEPKDYEVYEYLLERWHTLHFGPPAEAGPRPESAGNPKRRQREIARGLRQNGVETKAWQALRLARDAHKREAQTTTRARRLEEQARRYELRVQKKKDKHRGH